jgi:hypothetical protein
VFAEAEHDRPQLLDGLAGVSRGGDAVVPARQCDRVEHGPLLREHDFRLVAEVAEERGSAHLGPGGDVTHRHVLEAPLREQLVRRLDDALSREPLLPLDEGVGRRVGRVRGERGNVRHAPIVLAEVPGPERYSGCYGTEYQNIRAETDR